LRRPLVACFGSAVAFALGALPAYASVNYRTVALSGMHAPGTPTGATFQFLGGVLLTSDGKAVFSASLATGTGGVTSRSQKGIWSEASGTLSLVAREDDQAPGAPTGTKFTSMGLPVIGPDGHVALWSNGSGIWSQQPGGALTLVVLQGSPVPGAPAGTVFSDIIPSPNAELASGPHGTTAFSAKVKDAAGHSTEEIWYSDGTTLSLIAKSGTQGAGLPPGANYGTFEYGMIRMDAQAKTTFFGLLDPDGTVVTNTSDDAIWYGDANGLRLVARQGDQIPGQPAGKTFGNLGTPVINAKGQLAFRGDATGGGGIWSERHGTLAPVALQGRQAPGTPPGAKFGIPNDQVAISDSEATAFASSLVVGEGGVTASNDSGIWSEGGGTLALIAREGNPAPGTPDGAVFKLLNPPVINGAGRVAFLAGLLPGSGGVTADNDMGLWAQDPDGLLSLVVREGDPFEIAPGDVRTIEWVGFQYASESFDSPASVYTDDYTLGFALRFTDGSAGVFTATLVPEPGALSVALLAGVALRRPLRRTGGR